ncbi:MAG: aminotransferase class I/II-fold pyridoxal phosphate-dependent enzyme [Flavisolibacter sp.]|nr:aminotransferase class I/II-fold pyridoxal phosphate-dependent enzyme [Flavisolibacter sp.]
MTIAERIKPISEYYFSQKLREIEELNRSGERVINLGIGSPDLPPHPDVIRVLEEESKKPNVHAYQSYKGVKALRDAIAQWYQQWYDVSLNPDTEILPLIGSKEGIMHISMSFINPSDKVLVPNPGYPTYRSAALLAGGIPVDYELKEENNWLPDFNQLEQLVTPKHEGKSHFSSPTEGDQERAVRLMWVNYPHMPTGQLPTAELFKQLVSFGKKHNILICHDNPYSFILNEQPLSLLQVYGAKETAVELNSLSKSHNMAGWRVGMLCGAKENIDAVLRFKSNMDSGMFLPLQLAAAKALSLEKEWFDALNETYRQRRNKVFQLLDLLKCQYETAQAGMFVWAKVPDTYANSFVLSDAILHKARVFITPGGIFGSAGDEFIRVSLCSPEVQFEEAIKRISNR